MTRTENMPNWVYWALWGIKGRVAAMTFLVVSGILVLVVVPEAVMLGKFSSVLFTLVPLWYWQAIAWMDEHDNWD